MPDEVDGWQNGMSLKCLDMQRTTTIERFAKHKKRRLVSESEDDSSDMDSSSGGSGGDSESINRAGHQLAPSE